MTPVILFVCTANLCRSPLAQALAGARWEQLSGTPLTGTAGRQGTVRFASAGIAANDGSPAHPYTAAVLEDRGVPLHGFARRSLQDRYLNEAALVVTATRAHRAQCVQMVPSAVRRCFTLRQLSRLATVVQRDGLAPALSASPSAGPAAGPAQLPLDPASARLSALLAAMPAARGRTQPVGAVDDDLADPVLAGPDAFAACADTVSALLEPVLRLIAGP